MQADSHVHGLYVITGDADVALETLVRQTASAIRGGASLMQYRRKGEAPQRRRQQAQRLAHLCRASGIPFIVNDDISLAREVGATGIHLGKDDAPVAVARRILGQCALIGVSCYDSLQRAIEAQSAGADYVAFGSFFPSPTKPEAEHADPALLRQAKRTLEIPAVAIGGITPQNAIALIEAGADAVAVISGVFGSDDVEAAARRYAELFEDPCRGLRYR
jgi:thiamine-phosphate pyrophosphorylase